MEDPEREAANTRMPVPMDATGMLPLAAATKGRSDNTQQGITYNGSVPQLSCLAPPTLPRRFLAWTAPARGGTSLQEGAPRPTPLVASITTSASTPGAKCHRVAPQPTTTAGAGGGDAIARQGEAFASIRARGAAACSVPVGAAVTERVPARKTSWPARARRPLPSRRPPPARRIAPSAHP